MEHHHSVYMVKLHNRSAQMHTLQRLSPPGYFLQPMISQDGSDVVFWGQEEKTEGFNIWLWSKGNGQAENLTNIPAISGHPFWSTNAQTIVFFSTWNISDALEWRMSNQFAEDRAPRNIWIMNRDGSESRPLTFGPYVDERPCISPDGKYVVFVSNRNGYMDLWSVSTETGETSQFTPHTGLYYRPVFSPDGSRVACFSDQSDSSNHDLCILEWPGGKRSFPLARDVFKWVHGPFWLADGQHLLIHGVRKGEKECALWITNIAGDQVERIELMGVDSYGHGSLSVDESVMVFDSRNQLLPSALE